MVFNYGMNVVVGLYATDPTHAVWVWQVIETVAQGIGGAGGELLGGVRILLFKFGGLSNEGSVKAAELVWNCDRGRGSRLCRARTQCFFDCFRVAPDRVVHLGGDRLASHLTQCRGIG